MEKIAEHIPDIIKAAAQSQLGILALLCLLLAFLAYVFFSKSSEKAKLGVFFFLFLGVVGFGIAMFNSQSEKENSDTNTASLNGNSVELCKKIDSSSDFITEQTFTVNEIKYFLEEKVSLKLTYSDYTKCSMNINSPIDGESTTIDINSKNGVLFSALGCKYKMYMIEYSLQNNSCSIKITVS